MNLLGIETWPLWIVVGVFAAAAIVIAAAGSRLTRTADRLADATGLGEAIFGAVLLGGATSLPGIVTSVVTAYAGYPELSVSNAIGGIAAQTTFLAVADVAYRRANLEHAAASVENLVQGALLTTLLAIPLLAQAMPSVTLWQVHPASVLLVAAYLLGIRLAKRTGAARTWTPARTDDTHPDVAETGADAVALGRLWLAFAGLAAVVAVAGYVVGQTGIGVAERTGLSETVVGGLFTAVATSLPELVTSVAAVRQGALTLAVGGVIGGNSFDVLFVAFADVGYREGSIYHAITQQQVFVIALTIVLTGVLLMGLLRRERHGVGNIGFESALVLVVYLAAFALLFVTS